MMEITVECTKFVPFMDTRVTTIRCLGFADVFIPEWGLHFSALGLSENIKHKARLTSLPSYFHYDGKHKMGVWFEEPKDRVWEKHSY